MIRILALLVALLPLAARGQFGIEQPFFAATSVPCELDCLDSFTTYTNLSSLDGLNGGCGWLGAYVAKTYENIPGIVHLDPYESYATSADLQGLIGGVNWYTAYVRRTYEELPFVRYIDSMTEYTATDSMIDDTLALGTNYFFSGFPTNATITITWTNGPYVGKGY